jgi:hypothetical protein
MAIMAAFNNLPDLDKIKKIIDRTRLFQPNYSLSSGGFLPAALKYR